MSALPDQSAASQFAALANRTFGVRSEAEGQEATGAIGRMPRVQVLFVSRQGGPVVVDGLGAYWDARDHLNTRRKKGEWTGYHAEMMIVSAMLAMLQRDARTLTIQQAKELLTYQGAKCVIAANAPCCKHCAAMLEALDIEHPAGSAKASLTGWWNPLTDEVYPQASAEFQKDIPGA